MQRALGLELAACFTAALGLFVVSGRLDGSGTDAQFVFVLCLAAFGSTAAHMVPRLLDAALFRCPRCRELFHASLRTPRPGLRLRACAHCRLPVKARSSGTPSAR
jgi:hypothetical protein